MHNISQQISKQLSIGSLLQKIYFVGTGRQIFNTQANNLLTEPAPNNNKTYDIHVYLLLLI